MRLNKFIAQATGLSRRASDELIKSGRVKVDGRSAALGQEIKNGQTVKLDGKELGHPKVYLTIMLNKPTGYVCSRRGQGSRTIYNLLPEKYHSLKPVGRLDKDSSGLILLTDNGKLANELTHPRYQKEKVYQISLNKTLALSDKKKLLAGVKLSDGMSKFSNIKECSDKIYEVVLKEGKNRQIRRTLNTLGYKVETLHRTRLGTYKIDGIKEADIAVI